MITWAPPTWSTAVSGNHGPRPYHSGEVSVQGYNTLLTLSHLAECSNGMIVLENEVLVRTCTKILGQGRPGFKDLNAVAAHALASVMLPGHLSHRQDHEVQSSANTGPHRTHQGKPGCRAPGPVLPTRAASSTKPAPLTPPPIHLSTPYRPLPDLVHHLGCHPSYPLLTLRVVPQVAPSVRAFTTTTWPSIVRTLRQMVATGARTDQGVDWSQREGPSSGTLRSPACLGKSLASLLVLRGTGASAVDPSPLRDPALYPSWCVDPLQVVSCPVPFDHCDMSGSLLSNDQGSVQSMRDMLGRAYSMMSSGAYLHQYEKYGLEQVGLKEALAAVEELVANYEALA